jgi:hypothetical protein
MVSLPGLTSFQLETVEDDGQFALLPPGVGVDEVPQAESRSESPIAAPTAPTVITRRIFGRVRRDAGIIQFLLATTSPYA